MSVQEDTSHMRDANVRLKGRILYLTEDPGFVRAQLEGNDPAWTADNKLRDDISTDEITPAYICYYYDETLGEFPYLGLKCRDEFPITRGSVKRGGFVAAVSGKRRGKGSSRERSEEHTSELQSRLHLVCRLLLEKKKKKRKPGSSCNTQCFTQF